MRASHCWRRSYLASQEPGRCRVVNCLYAGSRAAGPRTPPPLHASRTPGGTTRAFHCPEGRVADNREHPGGWTGRDPIRILPGPIVSGSSPAAIGSPIVRFIQRSSRVCSTKLRIFQAEFSGRAAGSLLVDRPKRQAVRYSADSSVCFWHRARRFVRSPPGFEPLDNPVIGDELAGLDCGVGFSIQARFVHRIRLNIEDRFQRRGSHMAPSSRREPWQNPPRLAPNIGHRCDVHGGRW